MAGLDIIEDDIIKKIPNIVTSSYKGSFYLESVTAVIYITQNKSTTGVPIAVAEDNAGILWINDHATNLFFRFDPKTSQITK